MTLDMLREPAHQMALLPLLWLAVLRVRGRDPGLAWWWLAGAFFVSWLADTAAASFGNAWMIGVVYPVSQATLVAAVFLNRRDTLRVLAVFTTVAIADVLVFGIDVPDILFRTVAWGTVCGIVYGRPALGQLRLALLVAFGAALLAWLAFAGWLGWAQWIPYQGARLAGILLFCVAASHPAPTLRLSR